MKKNLEMCRPEALGQAEARPLDGELAPPPAAPHWSAATLNPGENVDDLTVAVQLPPVTQERRRSEDRPPLPWRTILTTATTRIRPDPALQFSKRERERERKREREFCGFTRVFVCVCACELIGDCMEISHVTEAGSIPPHLPHP